MNVLFNLLEEPALLSFIIILCAAIGIWQLIAWCKMKDKKEIEHGDDSAMIRAIIMARGPKGATMEEIKCELVTRKFLSSDEFILRKLLVDYEDQVGRRIENHNNDQLLRKRLETIEFIRSKTRCGLTYFFSEAPTQKHLAALIRKQKRSQSKTFRNSSLTLNASMSHQELTGTPKTWANSLIFRRSQLIDKSTMNTSMMETPNISERHLATTNAPKRKPSPHAAQTDLNESNKRFCHERTHDSLSTSNNSSVSDTTISRLTSQIMSSKGEVS